MTPQSAITILAAIASEREAGLRALLEGMNQAPGLADPHNELLPFYQFSRLHVARFVIIEANTNDFEVASVSSEASVRNTRTERASRPGAESIVAAHPIGILGISRGE